MFFPGETITHSFVIPFSYREINKVVVSYKQLEGIILEKTITSEAEFIKVDDNITKFDVILTQLDSLLFADNETFTIQVNVFLEGGTRHTSHEMRSDSGIQYLREVINPVPLQILIQPVNYNVKRVGDTASFEVSAQGVFKYQWQQSIDNGEWQDIQHENNYVLDIVSSENVISKYRYRCYIQGTDNNEVFTNIVKVTHTGGDE